MPLLNKEEFASDQEIIIKLSGELTRETAGDAYFFLQTYLKPENQKPLRLDLTEISKTDSSGVALVAECFRKMGTDPSKFALRGISRPMEESLRLAGWDISQGGNPLFKVDNQSLVEEVGDEAEDVGIKFYQVAYLVSETFYQGTTGILRGKFRMTLFLEQLARLGAGSAPIVLLVALLVGLTTAFQAASQLRQFGANIFIADLVSISMMRELGPLMAAILVAGRSGAAITAELGTMVVNEEIDALKLLGINPIQYLAVPRLYAISIAQPLLGVMSAIIGTIGGYFVAVAYLEINSHAYLNQTLQALVLNDLGFNLSKSLVFGWLIVIIGVYNGLEVKGGAEGVGKATTASVVWSIFSIIVADCLFSFS